jgi:asparagine synthase (glutamine-hydrolysing)
MCGIYGIFGTPAGGTDTEVLRRMGSSMRHRGPDGEGMYEDRTLLMGMQRLAIIDVTGGQQPLYSEDENVVVVCNGEIYNFRELRASLEIGGHRFATGSDAEVLVHLYEEKGLEFVRELHGIFAFAVWDRARGRLAIGRDRLGIKPLYVSEIGESLVFASELKSVLEVPGVERKINREALEEYLALGYVPAPMTIFESISKLAPGTLLVADKSGREILRYWSPAHSQSSSFERRDWPKEIACTIEESVVSQMVSDVPLGAFLSGGIDSSAVVAFMARNSDQPVKTYSIGFDAGVGGSYYNELPYARQVAELFHTDHHEIVVRPDVTTLLPELLWHMDEPIADAAFITTYLVSKFAREDVTVILSGVGGDELFGGYRRYWGEYLAQVYRKIPGPLRRYVLQPAARVLPSDRHSPALDGLRLLKGFLAGAEMRADERYEQFIRVFKKQELEGILAGDACESSAALKEAFQSIRTPDSLSRIIEVDLLTQLPDDLLMLTDRMSMAVSLECRVPLLDDALLDLSMEMPPELKVHGTSLKVGLKQALRGVLPDSIIDRKKRGFGAPIGGWFKHELANFLDAVLSETAVKERGLVDWTYLQQMRSLHASNREDYTDHLLALMNLELWCQMYIDGDSQEAVTDRLMAVAA